MAVKANNRDARRRRSKFNRTKKTTTFVIIFITIIIAVRELGYFDVFEWIRAHLF